MVLQIAGEAGGNISLPEARERFHPTLRWCLELPHRVGWDGEANFQKKDREKGLLYTHKVRCGGTEDTRGNITSWMMTLFCHRESSPSITTLSYLGVLQETIRLGGKASSLRREFGPQQVRGKAYARFQLYRLCRQQELGAHTAEVFRVSPLLASPGHTIV